MGYIAAFALCALYLGFLARFPQDSWRGYFRRHNDGSDRA